MHLPWFPFVMSARALAHLVDGLILLSALLLFAVICIAMIGAVPSWPITLILGLGAAAVFAIVYRFLFRFWLGGTPGAYLAGNNRRIAEWNGNRGRRETKIPVRKSSDVNHHIWPQMMPEARRTGRGLMSED